METVSRLMPAVMVNKIVAIIPMRLIVHVKKVTSNAPAGAIVFQSRVTKRWEVDGLLKEKLV